MAKRNLSFGESLLALTNLIFLILVGLMILSGTVKSNIGHLEGGSGIAGLIKTILILERGLIPPNANFKRVNPKIDVKRLKIKVRKP